MLPTGYMEHINKVCIYGYCTLVYKTKEQGACKCSGMQSSARLRTTQRFHITTTRNCGIHVVLRVALVSSLVFLHVSFDPCKPASSIPTRAPVWCTIYTYVQLLILFRIGRSSPEAVTRCMGWLLLRVWCLKFA